MRPSRLIAIGNANLQVAMNDFIWKGLTDIFRYELDNDSLVLTENMTASDVAGWDSITHVMIVVAVEKKFGVKLAAGEIQRLRNVGEFAALIQKKLS
jgi:acyl carrier protein